MEDFINFDNTILNILIYNNMLEYLSLDILNELNTYGGNSEMIEIDAMKFESVVDKKNIDLW